MKFQNGTLDLRDETITNLAQFWTAIDTFRMARFEKIERVRLTGEQERCLKEEVRPYMLVSGNVKDMVENPQIKKLMGYELLVDDEE